jgi:hypothetical protein
LDLRYFTKAAAPSRRTTTTNAPISHPPHIMAPHDIPSHISVHPKSHGRERIPGTLANRAGCSMPTEAVIYVAVATFLDR